MAEKQLSARERIIKTTSELLEQHGYYGTGLNQIIHESNAPKGSLYHYFPSGKEELAAAAIETKSRLITEQLQTRLEATADPAEAIRALILDMVQHMQATQCHVGAPIAAVALETAATSPRLRQACLSAYALWRELFEKKLRDSGFAAEKASQLATLIVAAVEGGIILSRVQQDARPLQHVAEMLYIVIKNEMS